MAMLTATVPLACFLGSFGRSGGLGPVCQGLLRDPCEAEGFDLEALGEIVRRLVGPAPKGGAESDRQWSTGE